MNRIKDLRAATGMTQVDLAKKMSCSANAISNYELGIRDIDSGTLRKICDIFECTADYLLGRSDLISTDLSAEEEALLLAFRRADERARKMVELALQPFQEKKLRKEGNIVYLDLC